MPRHGNMIARLVPGADRCPITPTFSSRGDPAHHLHSASSAVFSWLGTAEGAILYEETPQRQESARRFEVMGREFESAIDRLTDNEEIITGIKTFCGRCARRTG